MKLLGSNLQVVQHPLYDASGAIATGGTAQLVLARSMARSYLLLQNLSAGPLYVEFGAGRATCTILNGVVNSVTVTNAGFGFNAARPPIVQFVGGGNANNSAYLGLGQPNGISPGNPANGHAVITGGAISSIVIDEGGAGYVCPPYVFLRASDLDPYGCSVPSATSGIILSAQGPNLEWNGTVCPTEAMAIWGATLGQAFVCKWME